MHSAGCSTPAPGCWETRRSQWDSSRSTTASEDSDDSPRPLQPQLPQLQPLALCPALARASGGCATMAPAALCSPPPPLGMLTQALAAPQPLVPPGYNVGAQAPHVSPFRPPCGVAHRFHAEAASTGCLSEDGREFTKLSFSGRLSVITEDQVHSRGVLRYALQFTGGELASADGVGFIFSPKLPCCKNIQKIVSIFANRTGRICLRAHAEVIRSDIAVRPPEIGDWVTVTVDLDNENAEFAVWPAQGGLPSTAVMHYRAALESLRPRIPNLPRTSYGYFACVVKQAGVSMRLGS